MFQHEMGFRGNLQASSTITSQQRMISGDVGNTPATSSASVTVIRYTEYLSHNLESSFIEM